MQISSNPLPYSWLFEVLKFMDIDKFMKLNSLKLTAFHLISISSGLAFGKTIRENKIVKIMHSQNLSTLKKPTIQSSDSSAKDGS